MKFKLLVLSLILGTQLHAEPVYQTLMPAAGQSELSPSFGFAGGSAKSKVNPDVKIAIGSAKLGVSYYYGMAPGQALGAEIEYVSTVVRQSQSGFTDIEQKNKGLNNLKLQYKGLFETSNLSFFTKIGYAVGLEKEKYDVTDDEGNSVRGQNSLLLGAGLYAPIQPDFALGGYVNYEKYQDGEKTTKSAGIESVTKLSDGDNMTLAAFFELQTNEFRPNGSLGLIRNFSKKSTSASGATSFSTGLDFMFITGAAQFNLRPDMFIIPEVTLMSALSNDVLEKYSVLVVTANLRMLF